MYVCVVDRPRNSFITAMKKLFLSCIKKSQ
jgi:hypothetical protein